MRLGVNVDHIATLRQARKDVFPDIVSLAREAILGGADGLTVHLREDRRHIQDQDVFRLKKTFPKTHLNLEMAAVNSMADIALKLKPQAVCIVPENRAEVTTEGGLDVVKNFRVISQIVQKLQKKQIKVSLFINADRAQITAAAKSGAEAIEIHTGEYGEVSDPARKRYDRKLAKVQLGIIKNAAVYARDLGLVVHAGHGLTYANTKPLASNHHLISELNIGHNIIARALIVGLRKAVQEMKALIS